MKYLMLCALVLVAVSRSAAVESAHCDQWSSLDKQAGCDIPGSAISKPKTSDVAESEDAELDSVPDSSAQQWNIFSTIQDTITSVKDTIKYNVYKKTTEFAGSVYNTATEFAEKVRFVFREEFSDFLELIWETGVGTSPKSDSLFRKFQEAMVHKILTIGLFIICLLVSYIIWQSCSICTSVPLILAFNSSVLLIYKMLGPKWVYWIIWLVLGYTWYLLSFIWTYPYVSATVIVVFSIWGISWIFFERYNWTQRKERKMHMLEGIDRRLRRMEEQQEEILTLLKKANLATTK